MGEGGPARYTVANAEGKAQDVLKTILASSDEERAVHNPEGKPLVVVGSDTVVDLDGVILEKPKSTEAAKTMLRSLSVRPLRAKTCHLAHPGSGPCTCSSNQCSPWRAC